MAAYQVGSVLSRPVQGGIGRHYGIVVASEPDVRVVENQKFLGIREVSLEDFSCGVIPKVDVLPTSFSPEEVVFRARWMMERAVPYQLVNWNCETLVRYVVTGRAESLQSSFGAVATSLFVLATESYGLGKAVTNVLNDKPVLPEIPRMPGARFGELRRLHKTARDWEERMGAPYPFLKRTQKNRRRVA